MNETEESEGGLGEPKRSKHGSLEDGRRIMGGLSSQIFRNVFTCQWFRMATSAPVLWMAACCAHGLFIGSFTFEFVVL
jgi:hypothetical protein